MNSLFNKIKHIQGFGFLVGVIFGCMLSLVLFSHLVPSGEKMIGFYHRAISKKAAEQNKERMKEVIGNHMNHNPYLMNPITTESDFLKEMILHHESAVVMAEQVLSLPSVSERVKVLANTIITAQAQEIVQMKSWLQK